MTSLEIILSITVVTLLVLLVIQRKRINNRWKKLNHIHLTYMNEQALKIQELERIIGEKQ